MLHRILPRPLQQLQLLRLQFVASAAAAPKRQASSAEGGGSGDGFDTSFGYERVDRGAKQGRVDAVFERVSGSYDLMNDLMSFGLHRCWKRRFVASANPRPGWRCVDVAGGTGDVAIALVQRSRRQHGRDSPLMVGSPSPSRPPADAAAAAAAAAGAGVDDFRQQAEAALLGAAAASGAGAAAKESQNEQPAAFCHVTVVDPSRGMMSVGRDKAVGALSEATANCCIDWSEGRAESLPLDDASCHLYTIAFGMRNCTDLPGVLAEAYRVLRPYGRFACLEFCTVENPLLSLLYDEYSFRVIPPLGQLVASDWDSYQYLVQSIRRFPHQEAFAGMMRDAGFAAVSYEVLPPGVCCIHSGFKLPS